MRSNTKMELHYTPISELAEIKAISPVTLLICENKHTANEICNMIEFLVDNIYIPNQIRTLSQVVTSCHMAYAMQELTQGVPIWLKKFLLGPIVN